ncbi:HEAT repeat domain-containing protein [Sphingobacterium hotanense]|uniref:HEAT repeat domain-containing protein n=1 Tax=Sphingobacterium hotanense TaxID=649196 RepID=UPI0021A63194|nr:HEAT repeat domain-containing protein [Sphingobacterium hotanense]MCT1526111.1 HEAT repeat domain-containing protein [Sphingobacterium hotanense]
MDDQLKDFIKKNRTEFEFRSPSSDLRASILSLLSEKKKLKKRRAFRTKMAIAATVVAILSFSVLMLSRISETGITGQIAEIKPVKDRKESKTNAEVGPKTVTPHRDLGKQIIEETPNNQRHRKHRKTESGPGKEDTDRVLALMLSEDRPPSYRINGLQRISELQDIGEDLLDQVTETAVDDGNTNVRLAAVGVLASQSGMPGLQEHLISAFIRQDDPVVQSELIDIITMIDSVSKDPKVIQRLNEISNDPLSEGFVRERALVLLMEKGQ